MVEWQNIGKYLPLLEIDRQIFTMYAVSMAEYRYEDMNRRGKTNQSRFTYRESKERRMVYLWGYIDGSPTPPIINIKSYQETFRISDRTARDDLKEIRRRYPELIVIRA